jgi:hypothetical protein
MIARELSELVSQGDIFSGIPLFDFAGKNQQDVLAVLMTNDCDIEKRNHPIAHAVRIVRFDELSLDRRSILGDIREDRVPAAMMLPPDDRIPPAFVDFRTLQQVDKGLFVRATDEGRRLASLSEDGRIALFNRLYTYFRRKQQRRGEARVAPRLKEITPETDRTVS